METALQGSAAEMWRVLLSTGSLKTAVTALGTKLAVEEEVLLSDYEAFVSDLVQKGLLL